MFLILFPSEEIRKHMGLSQLLTRPDTLSFLSLLATTSKLICSAKSINHLFLNDELLVEFFQVCSKPALWIKSHHFFIQTTVEKFALTNGVRHVALKLAFSAEFQKPNFNDVYTILTRLSICFKKVMLITLLPILCDCSLTLHHSYMGIILESIS